MSDEGGHWYRRDGSPCYEVPKRGGGMRGINLAWDRGLNLVPSVTTVTSCMAKSALTTWMVKQGILAALTLPRLDGEGDDSFIARVLEDSKQQAKAAAEEGTRIHDACERLFKVGMHSDEPYFKHASAAGDEIARLFPDVNDWVSEKSFAHPLGFGGKVDVHSPSTGIVVDFKSKDGDFTELDAYGKPKKLAWDQHIQLAAYQVGLQIPIGARQDAFVQCANIFVSRTHPGAVRSHVWSADEIARGWQTFAAALQLWKILRDYDGAF